ncbi:MULTISPECIES: hypothetical protein [unclassified Bacillus cereus group]|uniref:hypothetical protein n=1 Tax=unclassified Bacillus cereus group TaxID=2750818 RepID=UPI0011ED3EF7|nr:MULTISPECIES: hypothetical protein [unclassified Bacillus cereus group]QEL70410.1 hypothetical protein DN399_20880 [Bacillus sp. AR4-2]QEL75689.1 hypothetical protein DN405_20880 [Bacillus sp. SH8-8]
MKDQLYVDILNEKLFNIYEGEINFYHPDDSSSTTGNITLELSPHPEILMTSNNPVTLKSQKERFPQEYDIRTINEYIMEESGSHNTYNPEQEDTIKSFTIYLDSVKTKDTEVDEVVFFIINCGHIGVRDYEEAEYKFEHEDWLITFNFRSDKKVESHYESLKRSRGYEITHVGSISKRDKRCFNTAEIEGILSNMEWYLSFCSAESVFIPIQIGLKDESKVWENYVIKKNKTSHYQNGLKWIPLGGVTNFNKFFSNVATKLEQELWKDVLPIVLNWYLEIKGDGMLENKIISTQIALEQLAWTYLVNQEQMLDKEGYKKLRATDILRLLCYQLNIPREIRHADLLDEEFLKKYQNDGVFMFVDFRNNLVHPDKKMSTYQLDKDTQVIVYLQGVYFLERVMTRIFGYKGKYRKIL